MSCYRGVGAQLIEEAVRLRCLFEGEAGGYIVETGGKVIEARGDTFDDEGQLRLQGRDSSVSVFDLREEVEYQRVLGNAVSHICGYVGIIANGGVSSIGGRRIVLA